MKLQNAYVEDQVLVIRMDVEGVTYEAMTLQCGRSVVQVLVVKVDTGVVLYEANTPMWEVSGSVSGCQSGYMSGEIRSYDTPLWDVSG